MSKKIVEFKPITGSQNRVVVKASEAEEKSKGGIIIPDTAKETPLRGEVISTSEIDDRGARPTVKKGDKILYSRHAGTEIDVDGEEFLIMREMDIYCII